MTTMEVRTFASRNGTMITVTWSDSEASRVLSQVVEAWKNPMQKEDVEKKYPFINKSSVEFLSNLLDVSSRPYRRLTEAQSFWFHHYYKNIMDVRIGLTSASSLKSPVRSSGAKYQKIVELFANVSEKVLYPRIVFYGLLGGQNVAFSRLSVRAKTPGSISVKVGKTYVGKISKETFVFEPSVIPAELVVPIEQICEEFNADPTDFAAKYGHRTGRCCFCSRLLTDERSTAVGYGPVCAESYRLPWGNQ